ncbi:CrcB family protein, partial [Bacillus sp. GbtcB10]|uniref:fluoride efflux transporter FluC n=1 Tax=Bacillus sp. GbtcB10 TaxID=2824755 RepID=UPI001C2F86B5
ATGFCSGITTMYTFSNETVLNLQVGQYNLSIMYIILSVIAGIAAALAGLIHAERLYNQNKQKKGSN